MFEGTMPHSLMLSAVQNGCNGVKAISMVCSSTYGWGLFWLSCGMACVLVADHAQCRKRVAIWFQKATLSSFLPIGGRGLVWEPQLVLHQSLFRRRWHSTQCVGIITFAVCITRGRNGTRLRNRESEIFDRAEDFQSVLQMQTQAASCTMDFPVETSALTSRDSSLFDQKELHICC